MGIGHDCLTCCGVPIVPPQLSPPSSTAGKRCAQVSAASVRSVRRLAKHAPTVAAAASKAELTAWTRDTAALGDALALHAYAADHLAALPPLAVVAPTAFPGIIALTVMRRCGGTAARQLRSGGLGCAAPPLLYCEECQWLRVCPSGLIVLLNRLCASVEFPT